MGIHAEAAEIRRGKVYWQRSCGRLRSDGRPNSQKLGSLNSAAGQSVAFPQFAKRSGRVELAGFSTRARAFGGREYFSRRCCRSLCGTVSHRVTTRTLLWKAKSLSRATKAFALTYLLAKNNRPS